MSDDFDPYRKWLGIPVEEQPPNHYRMLGIPLFESDWDVIENAAHRQMAYVRTFQNGKHAELSQRLLTELAAAKVCLMSPERKAEYDRGLHDEMAASRELGAISDERPVTPIEAAATQPVRESPRRPAAHRPRIRFQNRVVLLATLFGALGVFAVVLIVSVMAVNYRSGKRANLLQATSLETAAGETPVRERGSSEPEVRESLVVRRESGPASSAASLREARIRERLKAVRKALAAREVESARALLDGLTGLARDPQFSGEKERLDVIQRFLADFWASVDKGWERIRHRAEKRGLEKEGKVVGFEFAGELIEVKFSEDADPQLVWHGKVMEGAVRQWPVKVVVALAVLSLEESDGFARYHVAAFLLTDQQEKSDDHRRLGEAFYRQAEKMVGQPNPFVRDEHQLGAAPSEDAAETRELDLRVRPRFRTP